MDDKLKKALEFANYRQTLNNQLHQIKVTAENDLRISKNGGTFEINRELISFLNTLILMEQESAVLLDDNKTPIEITNLSDFTEEVTSIYFSVTNSYYADYERVRKSRKVESILDLDNE